MSHVTGEGADGRSGFTLVELLIVVVLVGILATIGVVHTRGLFARAYRTTMEADLKLLATHQELYEKQHYTYGRLADLTEFRASDGVTVTIGWVDLGGFAATAAHAALPDMTCGYYVGDPPEGMAGPATVEADIVCE